MHLDCRHISSSTGKYSGGIGSLDGTLTTNASTVTVDPTVKDKLQQLVITVRQSADRVTLLATFDGKDFVNITGPASRFHTPDWYKTYEPLRPVVQIRKGEIQLKAIRLEMLDTALESAGGNTPPAAGGNFALQFHKPAEGEPVPSVLVPTLKDPDSSLTMELWLNSPASGGRLVTLTGWILEFNKKNRIWRDGDGRYCYRCSVDFSQIITVPEGAEEIGKHDLVHLAAVRDVDKLECRLYVNGRLMDRMSIKGPDIGGSLIIGGEQQGKVFHGWMDEVRISSVARYDADFTPARRFKPDEDTLALYHFDEGEGDVLKDASGNGHHGKIVGAKWVKVEDTKQVGSLDTPAQLGADNALAFVDDTTFVHCPGVVIDQRGPYTVEAWIRDENRRGNLLSMRNGDFPRFIGGGLDHGLVLDVAKYKGVGVSDKPIPQTGEWAHVAGVYAEGEVRLYVDGELIGSKAVPPVDEMGSATDMNIGGRIHGSNSFGAFKGQIDEVRISNTTRYTDNFTPSRRYDSDEHTLALYHFDEGTGDILEDSSGNGHDGKIIGAKWVTAEGESISDLAPPPPIAPFDTKQAKAHQEAWAKHLGESVVTTNSIGMKLAVIPPGTFKMGESKNGVDVTLTQPFRLGIHEVTQRQWKAVMDGSEPWKEQSGVIEGDDVAATFVSWTDATEFCHLLTERERAAGTLREGWEYRLPTEAEWEWACRAGTTTWYSFGDDESLVGEYAWFEPNAEQAGEAYAHPVGLKKHNSWGLYDIHGNIWEWCVDWRGDALPRGTNPAGPTEGSDRVTRGGCWDVTAYSCRSYIRSRSVPSARSYSLGFRVALSPVTGATADHVGSSSLKTSR